MTNCQLFQTGDIALDGLLIFAETNTDRENQTEKTV